jgi:hypothetical protein
MCNQPGVQGFYASSVSPQITGGSTAPPSTTGGYGNASVDFNSKARRISLPGAPLNAGTRVDPYNPPDQQIDPTKQMGY